MHHQQQQQQDQDQRRLEHDIQGMVSSLTRHLLSLGKKSGHHKHGDNDHSSALDSGNNTSPKVVALAGDNKGATMRGGGLEDVEDAHGLLFRSGSNGRLGALANSNYQAANNSIMIGGSCTAEDPGVHIVIEDFGDEEEEDVHEKKEKEKKKKKDNNNKNKGSSDEEEYDHHETEKAASDNEALGD